MIIVATCLWDANERSEPFSRGYDESWADKLYRGFKRHLTRIPFEFVCFTDRPRTFKEPIRSAPLVRRPIGYGSCVEPFILDQPMIFVGLDTVITGNIDFAAMYCLKADRIALPKHPYEDFSINGVVLTPAGQRKIYDLWQGENDMDWMRLFPHARIDELWPGRVVSYKAHVAKQGLPQDARIVYFHGKPKPPELTHLLWIKEHWQ